MPHVVLYPMFTVMHCTVHQYFPQCVCSAQYGSFLQLLNFVLFPYVAQVLYDCEMVPVAPIITGITVAVTLRMR